MNESFHHVDPDLPRTDCQLEDLVDVLDSLRQGGMLESVLPTKLFDIHFFSLVTMRAVTGQIRTVRRTFDTIQPDLLQPLRHRRFEPAIRRYFPVNCGISTLEILEH